MGVAQSGEDGFEPDSTWIMIKQLFSKLQGKLLEAIPLKQLFSKLPILKKLFAALNS